MPSFFSDANNRNHIISSLTVVHRAGEEKEWRVSEASSGQSSPRSCGVSAFRANS